MLNGLDLFSGIGGLSIAFSDWVRPVAYCEIDPYCQGVLLSRMAEGKLANAPIWDDIKSFGYRTLLYAPVDIIYGGFPCQDVSVAGTGKGLAGERSGLFFEIMRLAKEIKPRFLFLENVPAITTRGGLQVVRTIAEMGYDCRWCVVSASSVGAPHKRERWFLLANAKSQRLLPSGDKVGIEKKKPLFADCSEDVADSMCQGLERREDAGKSKIAKPGNAGWWETEPTICRMADGIPNRVDRIKCLGNSVVPQQAKKAFQILMGLI